MSNVKINLSVQEKVQLFLRRPYAALGALFFIAGSAWLIGFSHQSDFTSLRFFRTERALTEGHVITIFQTELKDKYLHILKYTYAYTLSGKRYTSVSYGTDYTVEVHDPVTVEYIVSNPSVARMKGMRNAPFGLWIFFLLVPFSIAGLAGLIASIYKTKVIVQLLKKGSMVTGKLIRKQIPFINKNQKTIRLQYAYTKLGQVYTNITLTISPELFKEEEKILVSNKRYSDSVLLNALPQSVRWKVREQRAKQLAPCLN